MGRLCILGLGPLGGVVGFTILLVSPVETVYFETDTVTIVDYAFGIDFIFGYTSNRHTLTNAIRARYVLHRISIVASLADTNELSGFVFDTHNLVIINIGLIVSFLTFI